MDEFYVEEDEDGVYNMQEIITGLAYVMRTRPIDRVVALDDFDVEKGPHISASTSGFRAWDRQRAVISATNWQCVPKR